MKLTVAVRVLDDRGDRVFGTGIATLLAGVAETGSIRQASLRMDMAYSKAWRIIRTLERALGKPALVRTRGGRLRGGARLTPVAERLLLDYGRLCASTHAGAARDAQRLLRLFR